MSAIAACGKHQRQRMATTQQSLAPAQRTWMPSRISYLHRQLHSVLSGPDCSSGGSASSSDAAAEVAGLLVQVLRDAGQLKGEVLHSRVAGAAADDLLPVRKQDALQAAQVCAVLSLPCVYQCQQQIWAQMTFRQVQQHSSSSEHR